MARKRSRPPVESESIPSRAEAADAIRVLWTEHFDEGVLGEGFRTDAAALPGYVGSHVAAGFVHVTLRTALPTGHAMVTYSVPEATLGLIDPNFYWSARGPSVPPGTPTPRISVVASRDPGAETAVGVVIWWDDGLGTVVETPELDAEPPAPGYP